MANPSTGPATHRQAIERRVWRLGYLLSGDRAGASRLALRVARDQPHLENLDAARLDRAVIQHAREMPRPKASGVPLQRPDTPGALGHDLAMKTMRAALSLPAQPREAWILARVDALDDLHVSRAMDCSKTAAMNHLAAADQGMSAALSGELQPGIDALRVFADSLDPGAILAEHRASEQRVRRTRALVAVGVGLIAVMLGALVALRVLA